MIMVKEILLILMFAFLQGFLAAFFLLLAYKWGVVEYLQVHGSKLVSEMARCDFCMSWWLCVILTLPTLMLWYHVFALIVPLVATPICRKML